MRNTLEYWYEMLALEEAERAAYVDQILVWLEKGTENTIVLHSPNLKAQVFQRVF